MTHLVKRAAKWVAISVGLAAGGVLLFWGFTIVYLVWGWSGQVKAGRTYMDSLTEKDFNVWAGRSREFLSEYPNARAIELNMTSDKHGRYAQLAELGIIKVEVRKDEVIYFWMGGIDHTALNVSRMRDGRFSFYAHYDDQNGRQLWPIGGSRN